MSARHKAELQLKQSEEQLLSIFNNAISAVVLIDSNGTITSWNPRAEQIFGWTATEILNKPMHDFIIPEEHLEKHLYGMKHYKATGKGNIINSSVEITAKRKDQKIIDISLGVTTVLIKGRQFFIGFIDDITERKQAERIKSFQQRNRDALINATKDLIWSVSKDITLLTANEAFKESFKHYTNSTIEKGDNMLPEQLDENYTKFWKSLYDRALAGETFTNVNHVPKNENQEEQVVETNFSPIIIDGIIEGVACSARNITERIKTQEAIKEYNEKLKTAQEIANLGYWEHILNAKELYWSEQVYDIFEKNKESFKPTIDNFFDAVVEEDRQKFYLFNKKPIDAVDSQDIEYRIKTKSGIKWIQQNGRKIINPKNNTIVLKGTLRDITERKLQQQEIISYLDKLKTAQKIAKLGYWEYDIHSDILTWSDQVYTIWETTKETFEVSYDSFYNSIHPDDLDHFKKQNDKVMQGEKNLVIEHRIILPNGKIKWVIERINLICNSEGNPMLMEGTVQDITDQKIIEFELREQNEFIQTALENLPVGIAVNNLNTGQTTLMNRQFSKTYGWPKNELNNIENFFKKVYPDESYRNEMKSLIMRDIQSGNPKRMNWEGVKITTKKGEQRIINAKNIPVYEQNLMISTVLDVTEKTLAEQQLALSNERYEYVTKATFDAVWDWDLQKEDIFWGEGFKTIFGHNDEKTTSDYWFQHIHPEDRDKIKLSIENALSSNLLNWEDEYQFMKADGSYCYVKDRGIILRNVERKAIRFIGAMQDITPQKEYEQRLLDVNQKLRNLSAYLQEAREEERISIAREIHDELGQQLTGIKLDASWLKNKIVKHLPEDSERLERLIENINKAINDVRKVASNLRPGVLDDLGLEAAIEWQSQTFEEQTGIKIKLRIQSISTKLGKDINTAIYRIYQETLTNISRHAKATEIKTLLLEKNKTLLLQVEDNGIGIEETDKNNSFSLGITGMRERALMIQGTFVIEKQKKGGTIVKVLVPLFS